MTTDNRGATLDHRSTMAPGSPMVQATRVQTPIEEARAAVRLVTSTGEPAMITTLDPETADMLDKLDRRYLIRRTTPGDVYVISARASRASS